MTRSVDPGYGMIILSASNAVRRQAVDTAVKLSEDYKRSKDYTPSEDYKLYAAKRLYTVGRLLRRKT